MCMLITGRQPWGGRLPNAYELFWTVGLLSWWASLVWAYRRPLTFKPALVFGERPTDAEAGVVFYKRLALGFCLLSFSLGLLITFVLTQADPSCNDGLA